MTNTGIGLKFLGNGAVKLNSHTFMLASIDHWCLRGPHDCVSVTVNGKEISLGTTDDRALLKEMDEKLPAAITAAKQEIAAAAKSNDGTWRARA